MEIRQGTLEEMMAINQQIEEFNMPYGMEVLRNRLAGRNWLGLVAEDRPGLIGFKLGYELEPGVFYSWLGGVLSPDRGRGVARELLYEQERRLKRMGFTEVRVKSRNRYRGMVM
ncbi:MAG: GNAT family N-acetyltransferase, partial [Proteobacteria bacterium]|nr:GNAT family N-acetyltransferase [Pseudomonadota bacterium]